MPIIAVRTETRSHVSWRSIQDVKDPALIDQIEWGATDVHGRIFEASVSDIQDTFLKEKLVADRVPIGKIAPVGWVGRWRRNWDHSSSCMTTACARLPMTQDWRSPRRCGPARSTSARP